MAETSLQSISCELRSHGRTAMRKLKPILLVGSIPLADAEAVFRMLASKLGTRAKRYPDGETGHRTNWICWQRHVFECRPYFELENPDPSIAGIKDSQARPRFKLKDKRADIVLGALGYAKEAILSYSTFSRLKQSGEIPRETKFQVSIPTALALVSSFVSLADRALVEPSLEQALKGETDEIASAIPHQELAVQWDAVMEIVGYDGGYPLHYPDQFQGGASRICRHGDFVPEEIDVGIHLCYGAPGHKHIIEAKRLRSTVEFANMRDGLALFRDVRFFALAVFFGIVRRKAAQSSDLLAVTCMCGRESDRTDVAAGAVPNSPAPGLLCSMFAVGELSVVHCSSCLAAIFYHPLVTRQSAAG